MWDSAWFCNVKELWGGAIHCFVKVVSSLIMQCKGEVKFDLALYRWSGVKFSVGRARLSLAKYRQSKEGCDIVWQWCGKAKRIIVLCWQCLPEHSVAEVTHCYLWLCRSFVL